MVERSEIAVKKMEMIGLRQVSGGIPGHLRLSVVWSAKYHIELDVCVNVSGYQPGSDALESFRDFHGNGQTRLDLDGVDDGIADFAHVIKELYVLFGQEEVLISLARRVLRVKSDRTHHAAVLCFGDVSILDDEMFQSAIVDCFHQGQDVSVFLGKV